MTDDYDDYDEELLGSFLDPAEIKAGSGKTNRFTLSDVELASRRIDLAGVLPLLAQWRHEDEQKRYRGGRKPLLDDRAILVACMLIRAEGSPMWVTELRNVFWYRLTDDARAFLQIDHLVDTGNDEKDDRAWYERTWRGLHRIVRLLDAWPAPRRLMNREQRQAVISARDKNEMRLRQERGVTFAGAMLEMTFNAQPRRLRRAWKGALTVDQTSTRAPSQRGRRKKSVDTEEELIVYHLETGEEIPRLVLEIDADWFPTKKSRSAKVRNPNATDMDYNWEYMLTLVAQSQQTVGVKPGHPMLIMGASLNKPNFEVGEEALRTIRSIQSRGHKISRLTSDLGYGGNLKVENWHQPLLDLGVPVLTEYKRLSQKDGKGGQKGIKGGKDGALQVEGNLYCCATPPELLTASVDFDAGTIDEDTRSRRIVERNTHYKLRPKEKPDANGNQPYMCPAYGPGATVNCPLREAHARISAKPKPTVQAHNLPESPDKVCTQTSITVTPDVMVAHRQAIDYGTDEHQRTYRQDRNQIESINYVLKASPENIADPGARLVRGLAAQQFMMVMSLVSANLRRIVRYIQNESRTPRKKSPRGRDTRGLSNYPVSAHARNAAERAATDYAIAEAAKAKAARGRTRRGAATSVPPPMRN